MSNYENRAYASRKSANAFIRKNALTNVIVVENVDDGKFRIVRDAKASGGTKKGRVREMASIDGGTTIAACADDMHISHTAVRSLIGDLRRDGVAIAFNRETNTYHA